MEIRTLRTNKGLTQSEAASLVGLSLRTYQNYESGASFRDTFKKNNIIRILKEYEPYSSKKGIYTIEQIKSIANPILKEYGVKYAYLFGSYAKKKASVKSDIDILISNDVKGMKMFGLHADLMDALHKEVDIIRIDDLSKNQEFLDEILLGGIKIYSK